MVDNLIYSSEELKQYYVTHRNTWTDFYPSERDIFNIVAGDEKNMGRVFDVGCAAGGLGRALQSQFSITEYVGLDIHEKVIQEGMGKGGFRMPARLYAGDILNSVFAPGELFDVVVSLSCADWNLNPIDILKKCWSYVRPGGNFILTLRLTPYESIVDFSKSYQYIYFGNEKMIEEEVYEKAAYVVFNIKESIKIMQALKPAPKKIIARGYWGTPSLSAVTPYDKLIFSAFAVKKSENTEVDSTMVDIVWPVEALL
ncbi:class I SAM-dependent methyltransferase [uncultured Desulfobacter sp.]|uniref:class I SAM-dependent methyltransferase n=1 Tax=uncultured Desulfobacter sp. TaxID=240139 RepID=UPI002AABF8C9|nr:class I SAM-dependent methyltransferase [uncultured Desulfobacter sp.]